MQRFIVGSVMFLLVTLGWGDRGLTEQAPAPRGELRVVDKHPWNWSWIVLNVFEHLIELDKEGQPVPRLATAWRWVNDRTLEMPLRRGVKFQNGEAFDAEIVKLNWEENTRLRQPLAIGSFMNFKPGSRLEVIDSYTIRFVFPEPDGGALAKLRAVHIANR
jgi:ABC-type transport system substrate-binding protein